MLLWLRAEPFMRWLSFRQGIALALSGLIILMIVGIALLFGTGVGIQLEDVFQRTVSVVFAAPLSEGSCGRESRVAAGDAPYLERGAGRRQEAAGRPLAHARMGDDSG